MCLNKNSREISLSILTNVLAKNRKLNKEFTFQIQKINKKDISFVKNLVYGVLRIKDSIDISIKKYCHGEYDKFKERRKNILRIGFYQIDRVNSVPNYASVSTTVELAKTENFKFSKMTNAILMNFIRNKDKIITSRKTLNHCGSLLSEWRKYYSETEILDLCEWNNSIPKVWFRADSKTLDKITIEEDVAINRHPDIDNYFYFDDSKYGIEKFVKNGLIDVQSPSSGLVLSMLDIKKNDTIIDACAAPGGKSKHIKNIIDKTNKLHLNDKNHNKFLLLKRDFDDQVNSITCKDASIDKFQTVDKILLDVPCSSTGTIQKNPDIKWRKIDLKQLNLLQFKILKNMSKFLNKNGVIIYSTCSINISENFEIIDKFLKVNKNFKLDNAAKFLKAKYVKDKCMFVFPPKSGLEGMFAARLVKV